MSEHPMDLEKATESTLAKASARLLTPILLTAIAVLGGFLGNRVINTQDRQGDQINSIDKRTEVMNERMNNYVLDQLEQNRQSLNNHQGRIERLERAVPTL